MLVSDEPLFVEGKGKEGYVAHIHTKLLTCANQMPLFGEMDCSRKPVHDRPHGRSEVQPHDKRE